MEDDSHWTTEENEQQLDIVLRLNAEHYIKSIDVVKRKAKQKCIYSFLDCSLGKFLNNDLKKNK